MTMTMIAIIIYFLILILCWVFNVNMKRLITTLLITTIILFTISYFAIPEFAIKIRIVNETNKYQTLQEITRILSEEEIKYYKTAILFKSEECMNHTVNYIIKIGEDLSKTSIKNYLN